MASQERAALRIGEVARRTGVAVATLRAWEQRYGLLIPERTEGGHRRYGDRDLARVRRMQELLEDGWGADAAAREAREEIGGANGTVRPDTPVAATELVGVLSDAFERFDAVAANQVIDDVFARLDVPAALDQVLLPAIRVVGDGWETDPRAIAREHFATHQLRPRLLRMLRTPAFVTAPRRCVAAAPELEEHDIGLLGGAVIAMHAGFEVRFLGARTPIGALRRAAEAVHAEVLLVGAVRREPAVAFLAEAGELTTPMVLGGVGFHADDAERLPVRTRVHVGAMAALPESLRGVLG